MDALETELETYAENAERLLQESPGCYMLIRHSELAGVFEKQYDAIAEGYRRFGNVPFLVKKINGGRLQRFAR